MRTKQIKRLLFATLLCTSSISMMASEKLKEKITLSEFLNEISEKHEVYFTYNPTLVSTTCLLYTSPSPRDGLLSRMPSSA